MGRSEGARPALGGGPQGDSGWGMGSEGATRTAQAPPRLGEQVNPMSSGHTARPANAAPHPTPDARTRWGAGAALRTKDCDGDPGRHPEPAPARCPFTCAAIKDRSMVSPLPPALGSPLPLPLLLLVRSRVGGASPALSPPRRLAATRRGAASAGAGRGRGSGRPSAPT